MAKPLAEHKGVVKSRKKRDEETAGTGRKWPFRRGGPNEEAAAEAGFDMEYVPGGSVRRITFEDEPPAPEPEPERPARSWVPRHVADVRDIEAEVDRIGRQGPAPSRTPASSTTRTSRSTSTSRSSRLYETPGGYVDEARAADRRVLYTGTSRGRASDEDRRFSPAHVDRVLAERYRDPEFQPVAPPARSSAPSTARDELDETIGKRVREVRRTRTVTRQVGDEPPRVVSHETSVEGWAPEAAPAEALAGSVVKRTKTTRKVTKTVSKPAAKEPSEAPSKAAVERPAKAAAKAAKPAAKPVAKAETKPEAEEKEYQPQCAGLTQAGVQCRNSARAGSKYCSSHKGYRPPSAASLTQLDTEPQVKGAPDTTPQLLEASSTSKTIGSGDLQAQCAALTTAGVQCRNSSRTNSKYCASHKCHRAKSAAALKAIDTAPRHAGAADTKPALRKTANKSKKGA